MTRARTLLVVGVAAALVYGNAPTLGFALDDDLITRLNPRVTEGRFVEAVASPYWQLEREWGTLYRPVTVGSFVVEWQLWNGSPAGFHAVNVVLHAAVTVLVTAALWHFLPALAALVGGLFFAVHPVHVEAVANVAGRAELYAALGFMVACLFFLLRPLSAVGRVGRLLGVGVGYAVSLGGKEIGVTLPAVLIVLAVYDRRTERRQDASVGRSPVWPSDIPLFLLLAGVLASYLVLRFHVLGSITGEVLPAELVGLSGVERFWTALTLWPHYMRLMFFPVDLVADYGPGVFGATRSLSALPVAGAVVLIGLVSTAFGLRERRPAASLGIVWFLVTVLPVSHLVVHAGVLLAERTLYLPSVGIAFLVGALVAAGLERQEGARATLLVVIAVLGLMTVRTVTRVPVWDSTIALLTDLADAHPESHRALRLYGAIQQERGNLEAAVAAFDRAAALHPDRYPVLLEAGAIRREAGDLEGARSYLARAVEREPSRRDAYRLLAEVHLLANEGRAAHGVAVTGLAKAGPDTGLWAHLAESYLLRRDFPAAERALRAAVGQDPDAAREWRRLATVLEMTGDEAGAEDARRRAALAEGR